MVLRVFVCVESSFQMDLHEGAGRMEQTISRWDRLFIVFQISLDQIIKGGSAQRLGLPGAQMGADGKEQLLVSILKSGGNGIGSVESRHVRVISYPSTRATNETSNPRGDHFGWM